MKKRTLVAALLGICSAVAIVYALGLTALYCGQDFAGKAPIVCADMHSSDYANSVGIAVNLLGLVVLVGVPALVVALYMRFGWPHNSSQDY